MNDTTNSSGVGNSKILIVVALVGLIVVGGGSWFWLRGMQQDLAPRYPLADYGKVPNATLTERSGATVSLDDLHGDIWVANFIFTKCAGSCLAMSSKMSDLQKSLRKAGNVKLVSFTVDPKNDSAEKLQEYAKSYQAEKDKWLFLRTDYDSIQKLAKETFKMGIEAGEDPKEPIIHSTRFVLVDANGHIRGYYLNSDNEAMQKLLNDIGVLMRGEG